jgi:hypothetical protein
MSYPNLIDNTIRDTLCKGLYTCYLERIKLHYYLLNTCVFCILVGGVFIMLLYSYYNKKKKNHR